MEHCFDAELCYDLELDPGAISHGKHRFKQNDLGTNRSRINPEPIRFHLQRQVLSIIRIRSKETLRALPISRRF